jgi:N-acyl amino acid synthase of PEP-CTERM/exosortase system
MSLDAAPLPSQLGEGFSRLFEVVPALNDVCRDEVFFIRHEVYCRELGFEPTRADQREMDQYDSHAVHCLMRTAEVETRLVGCARVVLTSPDDRAAPLPFERTCEAVLDRSIIDPAKLPRERIAEVSRLAIMGSFRRRKGESNTAGTIHASDFGVAGHPRFPFIPVGLYLAAVSLAARNGIDYIFTLTEPRLAQHFAKLGVNIAPIGATVEHRGVRVPSMMNIPEIIDQIRPSVQPMWQAVNAQLDNYYAAADSPRAAQMC